MVAVMSEKKTKSTTIRIDSEIHRMLAIAAPIMGLEIGEIASEILAGPVRDLYEKAVAQEGQTLKKLKSTKPL